MNKIKYSLSLLVAITIIILSCSSDNKDKSKGETRRTGADTVKIPKDQYRIDEWNTGSSNQIIDLIQGLVEFEIKYEGTGRFKATLMLADGQVIDILADTTGNYRAKKRIRAPETRAYILKVEAENGRWSIYRQ
jgi:hypothetical protein